MTIDTEDLLNSIKGSFGRMNYIHTEDIPNIPLYMDQVTTFLDEQLKSSARVSSDEKLMTKTMINNYAKNNLIPSPEKKKYSKDHILLLIFIYYFKSMLSISDIKELLDPIISEFFEAKEDFSMEKIYGEIFKDMRSQLDEIYDDVSKKYDDASLTFQDAPDKDKEYLQTFSFLCKLSCDIFVKKLLLEKSIDSIREHRLEEENRNKAKEKGKAKDE